MVRGYIVALGLLCVSTAIIGCGADKTTEMPENPAPHPTEEPIMGGGGGKKQAPPSEAE